jgi:hypothetical protein
MLTAESPKRRNEPWFVKAFRAKIAARLFLLSVGAGFAVLRSVGENWAFGFLDGLPPSCPFRILTGFPCAFCGMTHAFLHAVFFDWQGAYQANALSIPLIGGGLVLSVLLSLGVPLRVSPRFRAKLVWVLLWVLVVYAILRTVSSS